MKSVFLISILLTFLTGAYAQTLKGIIVNGETQQPLASVTILNIATGMLASSGPNGRFGIEAQAGDKIAFSFTGFHTIEKLATYVADMRVELLPLTVNLPAYTLHNQTQFQRDSTEMTELYSKELNKKAIKPKVGLDGGLTVSGLIGAPVQRMSRSYKQNKKFKENFTRDMEQKYIDTKYKPELVTTLTGLTGDALTLFINTHPMDYAFARSATELEIRAWIRDTYKQYTKTAHAEVATPEASGGKK